MDNEVAMSSAPRLYPSPGQITARSAGVEGQVVTVSPLIRGSVDRVLVAENQLVGKGALLVELDHGEIDRKIAVSSAEFDAASLGSVAGQAPRRAGGAGDAAAPSESVRRSRARNGYLLARLWRLNADVRAPVDGRVIRIEARPRELVGIAQPLVTLLQSDELWIVASFDRGALERIRAGQRASVHAAGAVFTARVDSIAPADGQALLEFVESAVEPAAVLRPGAPAAVIVDTRGPRADKPMAGAT
jgi:multidrug resistance efflux pump